MALASLFAVLDHRVVKRLLLGYVLGVLFFDAYLWNYLAFCGAPGGIVLLWNTN